jgi:two-component sensor histidine kinase
VTQPSSDFQVEVAARPQSVAHVRAKLLSWLSHRAQIPERSTGAIALAVTEAVSNAARHAYPGGGGSIVVRGRLEETRLDIEVADAGRGFTPHADTATNGLGMMIIVRLADEVNLLSDDAGTRVRIGFKLAPEPVREAPARARASRARGRGTRLLHASG